jgi:cystathionine beta-synthase
VGRYLKEKKPSVRIVGADPEGSILREYFYTKKIGEAHPYLVEGIGEDIVPGTFLPEYVDEVVTVSDRDSFHMARRLSREEGLMVGGSAGSAAYVALQIAKELDEDKVVVVLLPDSGERYLSKFHSDEWMREHRLFDTKALTAGDLVRGKSGEIPPLVFVNAEDTVHTALDKMRIYNVSQLPVRRGDEWVGRVVEGDLMDGILSGQVGGDEPVERAMGEPFPILQVDAPYSEAVKLLAERNAAVLVKEGEAVIGIITKFDLVEYMLSEVG